MVSKKMEDPGTASVTVELTINRTALWMTIHGAMPTAAWTQFLSLPEARMLARRLRYQVRQMERRMCRPSIPTSPTLDGSITSRQASHPPKK
jgi:hypothetical protein